MLSDATVLWTLRPVVSTQTPIVVTGQHSQAMTVGQINVLVQTRLYGVDELKWTSEAAGTLEKEGDVTLMGDSCSTAVLFTTHRFYSQSYYQQHI